MTGFDHPRSEPAPFTTVVLPEAEGAYVTVVVRNHRIVQTGGTPDEPVLHREFLDEAVFSGVIDSVITELARVDGLSLCFAGEGFDPSSVPAGDEEALEASAAWAAVLFVPPGGLPRLRQAVSGALLDEGLDNAWLLPSEGDGDHGIVVRASEHDPLLAPEADSPGFWYGAIPMVRRPDGSVVDIAHSPAAQAEVHAHIDELNDASLLRTWRRARAVIPAFDPGEPRPGSLRPALHDIADEVLSDRYNRYTSHLCLEGVPLVLAGDEGNELEATREQEFYAHFAALEATAVSDDPVPEGTEGPPLSYDPSLSRLRTLVSWYADHVARALPDSDLSADPAGLADRLLARLGQRRAEASALVRAADAAQWAEEG